MRPILFLHHRRLRRCVKRCSPGPRPAATIFNTFREPSSRTGARYQGRTQVASHTHGMENCKLYDDRIEAVGQLCRRPTTMASPPGEYDEGQTSSHRGLLLRQDTDQPLSGTQFGICAANYPFISSRRDRWSCPPPFAANRHKIVGLTIMPQRLHRDPQPAPRRIAATRRSMQQELASVERLFARRRSALDTSPHRSRDSAKILEAPAFAASSA